MKKHLLIISCSSRKKNVLVETEAYKVYDGGWYKVINKFLRYNKLNNVEILIVSAKYGLIKYDTKIENYNEIMSKKRAGELTKQVIEHLIKYCKNKKYITIFINMGRYYMLTLGEYEKYMRKEDMLTEKGKLVICSGRIGERLRQLKNHLIEIQKHGGV